MARTIENHSPIYRQRRRSTRLSSLRLLVLAEATVGAFDLVSNSGLSFVMIPLAAIDCLGIIKQQRAATSKQSKRKA